MYKWNYIFLGANFSPVISGPPPKPAPPSFPNSPIAAGISPVKVPSVSATTVVPSVVQSVQSMNASAIGTIYICSLYICIIYSLFFKYLFRLLLSIIDIFKSEYRLICQ